MCNPIYVVPTSFFSINHSQWWIQEKIFRGGRKSSGTKTNHLPIACLRNKAKHAGISHIHASNKYIENEESRTTHGCQFYPCIFFDRIFAFRDLIVLHSTSRFIPVVVDINHKNDSKVQNHVIGDDGWWSNELPLCTTVAVPA